MVEPDALPNGLWSRMREDPQYAPEHLALEAVRLIGPRAVTWAEYVRNGQPGLHIEQYAEIAQKKFTNIAGLTGGVSGATGLPGAIVDVGVLAWNQARMVLHLAAIYDIDPAHPERATDLLVLQRVHTVAESARLALAVAAGRETVEGALDRSGGKIAIVGQLSIKLARMAGLRAVKRVVAKVIPGAGIVLGTWANRSATRELAERTRELYRAGIPAPRLALTTDAPDGAVAAPQLASWEPSTGTEPPNMHV